MFYGIRFRGQIRGTVPPACQTGDSAMLLGLKSIRLYSNSQEELGFFRENRSLEVRCSTYIKSEIGFKFRSSKFFKQSKHNKPSVFCTTL